MFSKCCNCERNISSKGASIDIRNKLYVTTYMSIRFCLTLALTLAAASPAPAQTNFNAGPTTRVLAIGRLADNVTRDKVMPVMPQEVRDTVRLYLAGKLDQWFYRHDQSGVVFLLNVATVAEAHALLEALPLGKAKLMEFDLIPLGPLTPLGMLLTESETPKK